MEITRTFAEFAPTPGAVTVPALSPDTIDVPDEDDDEGEEEDPANPDATDVGGGKRARPRTKKRMPAPTQEPALAPYQGVVDNPGVGVNKTAQSAAPARLLDRYDALIESVEAVTEDLDQRKLDAQISAVVEDLGGTDASERLEQYFQLLQEREIRVARKARKRKASDQTKFVPPHDHARDPNGKVTHAPAKKAAAAAVAS